MNQCLLCGTVILNDISLSFLLGFKAYQPKVICQRCRNQFESIDLNRCCQFCGKAGAFDYSRCSDCSHWLNSSTAGFKNRSLYRYNSKMQEYMHRYKFQGDYRLRRIFQSEFIRCARGYQRLIIPIPLHPATYQNRGFNQVRGLLGTLKLINVLQTRNLSKIHAQSSKGRQQRLVMEQPFKLIPEAVEQIKGRNLLVVDDVYTTGTTIRHAAQLLKHTGARSVCGLTLAH